MVTSLFVVRHGQSTWNAERRWQGQADPPLSDFGREQAIRAAASLEAIARTIDAVVSSPQLRAAETATLLVENASSASGVASIHHDPDLRERSAGEWSGLTTAQIEDRYPGFLASGRRPIGFESDESLFDRVERALRSIEHRYARKTILAVCHGGVINTLVAMSGTVSGRVPNLSGHRVTITRGDMSIGERFDLLDEASRTGGDSARL